MIWEYQKDSDDGTIELYWTKNYWCSDGDCVQLEIWKDGSRMQLHCFTGIPDAAYITITDVALSVFTDIIEPTGACNFKECCFVVASYLCDKLNLNS